MLHRPKDKAEEEKNKQFHQELHKHKKPELPHNSYDDVG